MVLVLFFAGLISYLNDGRIAIEGQHLLIALLVGLCAFLGWPRPKTDQPRDPEPPSQDRA
jgi:hypothetical protein